MSNSSELASSLKFAIPLIISYFACDTNTFIIIVITIPVAFGSAPYKSDRITMLSKKLLFA